MDHIYLKRQEVHKTVNELHQLLMSRLNFYSKEEQAQVEEIYILASKWYKGKKRYSGDDYFTHPLNVAILLSELEADLLTIQAGLLCDVLRKGFVKEYELAQYIPDELYKLIRKLTEYKSKQLSLPQDEQTELILIAEWLHNMRTVEFMEKNRQKEKARETIEQIMPLAARLDNKKILSELNELVQRILSL